MPEQARRKVLEHSSQGARLRETFFEQNADAVVDAARILAVTMARGHKLLLCGNGGSAADAQHLAAEFVNRFQMERPPLPAIALTTDSSIITSIGNDYSYDQIFEKQVQALGNAGDMFMGISTSGNSPNVVRAMIAAREKGLTTMGVTGQGGGEMAKLSDILFAVDCPTTALVQEVHIALGHLLCGLTDHFLFENVLALQPWLEQNCTSI